MKKITKSKAFWLLAAFATVIIFLALTNFNRTYKSDVEILVIPKSEKAINSSKEIIANLRAIPKTLSFYNRMAADNSNVITDAIRELPDYKKKNYWNSKISTQKISRSGVIEISITDKDFSRAQTLSVQSAKILISSAGLYYNIKDDVDIRILDGPTIHYSDVYPVWAVALISLVAGLFLAYISFFISFNLFSGRVKKDRIQPLHKIGKEIKFKPAYPKNSAEQPWISEEKSYADFAKKASAPGNLPIQEQEEDSKIYFTEEKKKEKPATREATEEEVKERLNRLLSGKL